MALSVNLNGHTRVMPALAAGVTLDQVIVELGLKADRIAVEHNGEIVARSEWSLTVVQTGDRLEIVHFVGGGGC